MFGGSPQTRPCIKRRIEDEDSELLAAKMLSERSEDDADGGQGCDVGDYTTHSGGILRGGVEGLDCVGEGIEEMG